MFVSEGRAVEVMGTRRRDASDRVRRNRRLLVAGSLAITAVLSPLGLFGEGPLAAPGQARASASGLPRVYVVQPGDTLWSISTRMSHGGDPRVLESELAAQLRSDSLQPGERITLSE